MDTAFFWLSKLVWSVIAPESVLFLLVVVSWVLLLRGKAKWGKRLLGIASVAMLVLACLPVGEWMIYPLEDRFPANPALPDRIDGIIVLGGAEDAPRSAAWEQVEVNDSAERFLASAMLAKLHPEAKLLFTSGSGDPLDQLHKGSTVARQLYEQQGIDMSRVLLESESRNTAENVALSKALVKPKPGEIWVLVTSAFHMPRSIGIFCKAGWPVVAYPVDHRTLRGHLLRADAGVIGNLNYLTIAIREWVGLAAYYATGKTSALFPAGCP